MENKKLIASITIPKYLREINASKKQREKYYEWNGVTIKSGSKKLLQKYINSKYKREIIENGGNVLPHQLKESYIIVGFKGQYEYSFLSITGEHIHSDLTIIQNNKPIKYFLCTMEDDGIKTYSILYKKVIANETQAGKPKKVVINGQQIYNHTASPFLVGKIFDAIKLTYYEKFITINPESLRALRYALKKNYPLQVDVEVCDTIRNYYDNSKKGLGKRWDVGNRTDPYMKTFLDFIATGYVDEENNRYFEPLIEDDDRLHISSGNNSFFTPILDEENRRLVFHIYKDTRPIWNTIFNQLKEQDESNT